MITNVREHEDILSDNHLARIILIVRNYYDEPEDAEAMWSDLKSDHTLFDFNNIIPTATEDLNGPSYKWGVRTNAIFPRFYDESRHSLTFLLEEMECIHLMQVLSKKYPTLELMTISSRKSILYNSDAFKVAEYKGGDYNRIWTSLTVPLRYLLSKVLWQSEFKELIAYDIYDESLVFLNKEEELKYDWQNKNLIYYASAVKTIFDIKLLQSLILSKANLSYSTDDSHRRDLVYIKAITSSKEEED